jgi:hypothetical protein
MKSTKDINMEGIEVNAGILKAFKNFKQGKLLESNYVQTRYVVSYDMLEHANFDVREVTKREMVGQLSNHLLEKYKDSFEEIQVPYGTEFSLEMLAMSTRELKHIVEYCIRTMSQSAINEIRK